jgi:hypothetical protein
MLNICGIKDKTPDDIFYYGVFCDVTEYTESLDELDENKLPKELPNITVDYGTDKYKAQIKAREKYIENLIESIVKGEKEKPDWLENLEINYYNFPKSTYLYLITKDDKYSVFADKIKNLLKSVSADGYMDG